MDDLISRQAAIDYFVLNVGFHDEDGYPIEDADELRKIWTEYFDGIPPAQPKRGRWVLVCDNNGMHFICNKCGAWRYHQEQKFCGECGADMRGGQE